jgi:hypothetical protein
MLWGPSGSQSHCFVSQLAWGLHAVVGRIGNVLFGNVLAKCRKAAKDSHQQPGSLQCQAVTSCAGLYEAHLGKAWSQLTKQCHWQTHLPCQGRTWGQLSQRGQQTPNRTMYGHSKELHGVWRTSQTLTQSSSLKTYVYSWLQ